jgi:phosphate uptake regulator
MGSMGDRENEVRIDITGNVDGLKAATPQAVAELSKLEAFQAKQTTTTRDANTQAERYIATLKRQVATYGQTRGQVMAYDAQMKGLTGTHLESAKSLGTQLDALEANEKMLGRVKIAAGVAGAAIGAFAVQSFRAMINETMEAEQSTARLEAVYRATGGTVKLTLQEVKAVGEELYRTTLFDDDQITDATAAMLTFKNVQGDSFRQAMQMSADLAAVMKTDLQSAVVQLGKALEDPEQGLQGLRRAGVSFSDDQRDLIKAMVETGNQSAALTEIMRIMREQGFDKTAQAMKIGITKQADELGKEWRDLLETLGETETVKGGVEGTLGAITSYLRETKSVIESGDWFDKLIFYTWGHSPFGLLAKKLGGEDAPRKQRGASGSWGEPDKPAAAPQDPAVAQALACYQKGGKWENGKCVLRSTRTGSAGPKPTPYADVFTGQEYSRAQMNSSQLGGFSYITNNKATTQFIREQQDAVNSMQGDIARDTLRDEKDLATQREKNADQLERMKEQYLNMGDPLRQYYQQLDELAVLKEKFPQLADVWLEAELNVHEQIDAAMNKTTEKSKDAFADMKRALEGWGKDAANAFADWAMGAETSIGDVAQAWAREMLSMMAYKQLFEPMANAAGNMLTTAMSAIFSAKGNAFEGPSGMAAYRNQVVDRPTIVPLAKGAAVIGEKPGSPGEGVFPLTRMRNGDLGVQVAGGGGMQLTVNLIESPGNGGKTEQRQDNNGSNILDVYVEKIKGSIAGDISAGRGAIPNALAGTYGLNRVAGAY